MKIEGLKEIGRNRPACVEKVRVAAGLVTNTAKWRAHEAERRGLPIDQCGRRADFMVDGQPICRAHAGARALQHVIDASHVRTNEEEIARPRCGCDPAVVRNVLIEHGTCSMGGCPYGGDF